MSGNEIEFVKVRIAKLSAPVIGLVNSVKRPSRADCENVLTHPLFYMLNPPDVKHVQHTSEPPVAHIAQPMPSPNAIALNAKIRHAHARSTMLRLKSSATAAKRTTAVKINFKSVCKSNSIDFGKISGTGQTHSFPVSRTFKRVSSQAKHVIIASDSAVVNANKPIPLVISENRKPGKPPAKRSELKLMTRRKQWAASNAFFETERLIIASHFGINETRLRWIGLFRNVPIGVVEALRVDESAGLLILTLHGDALKSISNQLRANVNIAMGRDTQNGTILQVVVK